MIQLDSTAAKKFAVHLEGYEGLEVELVKNGDFSELGSDLVTNGDFSATGSELATYSLGNISFNNKNGSISTSLGGIDYRSVAIGDTNDARPRVSFDNLTEGKSYKVVYTPSSTTGASDFDLFQDGVRIVINYDITLPLTAYLIAGSGYNGIDFNGTNTFTTDYTLSIKELGEGWTVENTDATHYVEFIETGARFVSGALSPILTLRQDVVSIGKYYKITCDATYGVGSGKARFQIGSINTSSIEEGSNVLYISSPTTSDNSYILRDEVDVDVVITNVSIQQLDPNGYWNTNPNWSLEQGQAVSDGTNVGSLNQAGVTTLGKTYVAKYDILTYTSGTGFQQRVGSGSAYSNAETSIATHSTTQIATGNDYIYINPNNTIGAITNVSVRLKNTGAVTLTLTNQLTEKVTTVNLTPLLSNGRYTEFSYQPTGLIEGMYLIKFTGDSTTYAETLAYITTGTPPLGESEYKEYTTGDDNPDHVYIP